jgi:outer membrane protein OmpA-like peptidoglycan-associated protein
MVVHRTPGALGAQGPHRQADGGTLSLTGASPPGPLREPAPHLPHEVRRIVDREMARPRVAAPQSHRGKSAFQEASAVDLKNVQGRIAKIFFPVDSCRLDADDQRSLQSILAAYRPLLGLRRVTFTFVGYADIRGTESRNQQLGQTRATAVCDFFAEFKNSRNYAWGTASGGVEGPSVSTDENELKSHRRVDLIADPPLKKLVDRSSKPEPPKALTSYRWKMRLLGTWGAGGAVGANTYVLEIVDLDNWQSMHYSYAGFGVTAGLKMSAGLASDWRTFETSIALRATDFAGPARHTCLGFQVYRGISVDIIHLLGPTIHGAAPIYEGWAGLWETGIVNIGGGIDLVGGLVALGEPIYVGKGYQGD